MRRPLSTKNRIEILRSRFFKRFSRIWRNSKRYKAESMGESANPWPTPTSMSNRQEEKLFQK